MMITEKLLHHRNPFVRKGTGVLMQVPRRCRSLLSGMDSFQANPAVLANSFPKSGTHLLEQVVAAFPDLKNYGAFLASMTSSRTFRERKPMEYQRFIKSIVPGELLRGHLFFEQEIESALGDKNVIHFFIYRDLRDVAVSEAHYLYSMNRWHRLYPYYQKANNIQEAISFAINGIPNQPELNYPNIGERFRRYRGWLNSPSTFCVKYEELVGEQRNETVYAMVEWFANKRPNDVDIDSVASRALAAIDAGRSHTFRKGGSNWEREFTDRHHREFDEVTSDLQT